MQMRALVKLRRENLNFQHLLLAVGKSAGLEPGTGNAYKSGCLMGKYFENQKEDDRSKN